MTIHIRPADERDVDRLVALNRVVHELHRAAEPAFFKPPDYDAVAELFRSRLAQAETRVWVAEVDAVAAGYAVAVLRDRPENAFVAARRFLEVEDVAVDQLFRRQGVARALLERVSADARAQGVSELQLNCWAFNAAAQTAFTALGFRPLMTRFHAAIDSPNPNDMPTAENEPRA